jgi:hypothetical protein
MNPEKQSLKQKAERDWEKKNKLNVIFFFIRAIIKKRRGERERERYSEEHAWAVPK